MWTLSVEQQRQQSYVSREASLVYSLVTEW